MRSRISSQVVSNERFLPSLQLIVRFSISVAKPRAGIAALLFITFAALIYCYNQLALSHRAGLNKAPVPRSSRVQATGCTLARERSPSLRKRASQTASRQGFDHFLVCPRPRRMKELKLAEVFHHSFLGVYLIVGATCA